MLSDNNEGISISFNKNGICGLRYKWSKIHLGYNLSPENYITRAQAEKSFVKNYHQLYPNQGRETEKSISNAYYIKNGKTIPVCIFSDDSSYLNPFMIHALNGEIVI